MAENKTIEVKGLGTVTEISDGKFKMSNADAEKFFAQQGVENYYDVVKQLTAAKNKLAVTATENLLKDEVIKNGGQASLRVGAGSGRIDLTFHECVQRRNGQTGEVYDVYGVLRTKEHWKSPMKNPESIAVFDKISQEIEAAAKKRR